MSEAIRSERRNGVLSLIIQRPGKKNALTAAMYAALSDAMAQSDADPAIGAILVRSEGDLFTAGNDMSDFAALASGGGDFSAVTRFVRQLASLRKPLLAAVQGKAIGIGMTMLLHCDLVLLTPDAEMSVPFVNLALVPEAASSMLLPARIGHPRAFEAFVFGGPIVAADAVAWGLANRIVPVAELASTAHGLAERIAAAPPEAVMATKRMMRDAAVLAACIDGEMEQFTARLSSAEAKEAFAAFAEKRKPDFGRRG